MSGMGSSNAIRKRGKSRQAAHGVQCRLPCLSPCSLDDGGPADIFAVGFEEMVELSAGNIVNAR